MRSGARVKNTLTEEKPPYRTRCPPCCPSSPVGAARFTPGTTMVRLPTTATRGGATAQAWLGEAGDLNPVPMFRHRRPLRHSTVLSRFSHLSPTWAGKRTPRLLASPSPARRGSIPTRSSPHWELERETPLSRILVQCIPPGDGDHPTPPHSIVYLTVRFFSTHLPLQFWFCDKEEMIKLVLRS